VTLLLVALALLAGWLTRQWLFARALRRSVARTHAVLKVDRDALRAMDARAKHRSARLAQGSRSCKPAREPAGKVAP
jgi:hypothetical protein